MKIQVVIPVLNEEMKLGPCLEKLTGFLSTLNHGDYRIVVADNGSTDQTYPIGLEWKKRCPMVDVIHLPERGRGRALKTCWNHSNADILSYMDVDLSTGLDAFPRMIDALSGGDYDLAIGSRLLSGAKTTRCLRRELISRIYNLMLKSVFNCRFSDAQCGFKAIVREAADRVLPLVEDNYWFFDTELLLLAEKLRYRIFDIPVQWIENPDSRVEIFRTAKEDIRGMMRLRRQLAEKCPVIPLHCPVSRENSSLAMLARQRQDRTLSGGGSAVPPLHPDRTAGGDRHGQRLVVDAQQGQSPGPKNSMSEQP